jgi:hypothetical protein
MRIGKFGEYPTELPKNDDVPEASESDATFQNILEQEKLERAERVQGVSQAHTDVGQNRNRDLAEGSAKRVISEEEAANIQKTRLQIIFEMQGKQQPHSPEDEKSNEHWAA